MVISTGGLRAPTAQLRRAAPGQLEAGLVDQGHGAAADDVVRPLAAEQGRSLLVGQDDHPVAMNVDRFWSGLDQGAVALLAFPQCGIGTALR